MVYHSSVTKTLKITEQQHTQNVCSLQYCNSLVKGQPEKSRDSVMEHEASVHRC
jgi:hypothetical protein